MRAIEFAGFTAIACASASALAQQATLTTPFHAAGTSFFEQTGTQWGVQGPGFHFQFGGPAFGQPAFGNPSLGGGVRGGWNWNSGPWSGHFGWMAAQGSQSSLVSQVPSITVSPGRVGYFYDASLSPFVIGYIPIVGTAPQVPFSYAVAPPAGFGAFYPGIETPYVQQGNPRVQAMLQSRAAGESAAELPTARESGPAPDQPPAESQGVPPVPAPERVSTAASAAPSVADARLMHQQEQAAVQREVEQLLQRGMAAEQAGKPGVARIYYRMAADRAGGLPREPK